MRRQPKGTRAGGQFARDTRGVVPPTPADLRKVDGESAGGEDTSVLEAWQRFEATDVSVPALPGDGEPAQVRVVRGLPGSGKSTWARSVLEAHPPGTVVRINNDELSGMLFGRSFGGGDDASALLGRLREVMVGEALARPTTRLVLVDNTNLSTSTVSKLFRVTDRAGGSFVVDDRFLSVPVEECWRRNTARDNPVPRGAFDAMARQAAKLRQWRNPAGVGAVQPYHNDPSLPGVTVVDVDGTLAVMNPNRGPYDWDKVGADSPNAAVVDVVRQMRAAGRNVVVFSGRSEECRDATQRWLDTHVGEGLSLHMRPARDSRPDDVVKLELFDTHLRDRFHVQCVLDDRDQVVRLWRDRLGLPTFQVANGAF